MNPRLARLQPYPFQKLAALLTGLEPPKDRSPIRLSIGEPQDAAPPPVLEALAAGLAGVARYPATRGSPELRDAIARWANRRYRLARRSLDPGREVLPVAGTREALFSIAQALIDGSRPATPAVLMPNPFYQIYEGAALLAGAEPWYVNTTDANGYRLEFSSVPVDVWRRTQLLYVCTPGNPAGAVLTQSDWADIFALSERHGFVIVSDECYSEIYVDETDPPLGVLQAAAALGIEGYRNCLAFNSLSKRSNLPGLRSGFVAGDAQLIERYFEYRTYQGCALPPPTQAASIAAWDDETHVQANRARYRERFDAVLEILGGVLDIARPAAGFYLWPALPQDDETFCRELYARENVLVLPGRYLSRAAHGIDPGAGRARIALVAPLEQCVEAARRMRRYIESLTGTR